MARGWTGSMKLPEFRGESGESWEDYESALQWAYEGAGLLDVDPIIKRAHVVTGLQGRAKEIFKSNTPWKKLEYEELMKQLRAKFCKTCHDKTLFDLPKMRQGNGETISEYVARLRNAARSIKGTEDYQLVSKKEARAILKADDTVEAVKIDEFEKENELYDEIIDRIILRPFLEGVNEEFRSPLNNARPTKMADAVRIAEEQEKFYELYPVKKGMTHLTMASDFTTHQNNLAQPESRNPAMDTVQQASQQLKQLNQPSQPKLNESRTYDLSQVRCYYCSYFGHFARECHKRQRDLMHGAPMQQRMPNMLPLHNSPSTGTLQHQRPQGKPNFIPFRMQNHNPNGTMTKAKQERYPPKIPSNKRYRNPVKRAEKSQEERKNSEPGEHRSSPQQYQQSKNGARQPARPGHWIPKALPFPAI